MEGPLAIGVEAKPPLPDAFCTGGRGRAGAGAVVLRLMQDLADEAPLPVWVKVGWKVRHYPFGRPKRESVAGFWSTQQAER